MFPSLQSFISYHVLTDERREAVESTHVENSCSVDMQINESFSLMQNFCMTWGESTWLKGDLPVNTHTVHNHKNAHLHALVA